MRVEVRVKPGSKRDRVTASRNAAGDYSLLVELRALAEGGKANAALAKLLAKHFGVTQADIRIKLGAGSRRKLVEVTLSK